MTYKELKHKIKEEQKVLAQDIREYKELRKGAPDGYVEGLWHRQNDYRHIHIAYCQYFNNTPYSLIEQPRDGNKPDSNRLKNIQTSWEMVTGEALRNCA